MPTRRSVIASFGFAAASVVAAGGSFVALSRKRVLPASRGALFAQLPTAVGAWRQQPARDDMIDPIVIEEAFAQAVEMYDAIVARDYTAPNGKRIMFNAVFMRKIAQEARFHWPEFCYATQGFRVDRLPPAAIPLPGRSLVASRFLASRDDRREVVLYWMRIGDAVPTGSAQVRLAIFRNSFAETMPDGVLVRASIYADPGEDIDACADMVGRFLARLVLQTDGALRPFLVAS